MRRVVVILLALSAVTPASAQSYAEQQYQPQTIYPQQQANITTYPAPVAYPQPVHNTPAPAPVPASQREYQPGDYGASVMTDIRQMNF